MRGFLGSNQTNADSLSITACDRVHRRKIIAAAVAAAVFVSSTTPRPARADTPLLPAILIGIGTGIAANYIYDKLKQPNDPPPKQRMFKNTTITKPDGTVISQTIIVDPTLDFNTPTSHISLPSDWSSPPIPGDTTSGTFPAHIDTNIGGAYMDAGGQFGGDIHAAASALGNAPGTWHRTSTTDEIVQGWMDRNTAMNTNGTHITLNPGGPLNMSTVDLSDTTGTISYVATVRSTALGGTLFSGGVSISQGASTFSTIGSGFPGASYQVTSPGDLKVTFGSSPIDVMAIPDTLNHLDFSVDVTVTDTESLTIVPEPGTSAMLGVFAMGLFVSSRRRRAA